MDARVRLDGAGHRDRSNAVGVCLTEEGCVHHLNVSQHPVVDVAAENVDTRVVETMGNRAVFASVQFDVQEFARRKRVDVVINRIAVEKSNLGTCGHAEDAWIEVQIALVE